MRPDSGRQAASRPPETSRIGGVVARSGNARCSRAPSKARPAPARRVEGARNPPAGTGGRHLRDLFAEDPGRGERLCAEAAGLYLDYSKNRSASVRCSRASMRWTSTFARPRWRRIEVMASPELVAQTAAEYVARRARHAVAVHGHFTFAVSGGHTPWVGDVRRT